MASEMKASGSSDARLTASDHDDEKKMASSNHLHTAIKTAVQRINGLVRKTPLEYSHGLSQISGASVYVKYESEQITGSFKLRGAFNKLKFLMETSKKGQKFRSITASTGNHALACAYATKKLNVDVLIYVPENISAVKNETLKALGANLQYHGTDCVECETNARALSEKEGLPYISPYNDIEVMAGQGTIGSEILEDLPEADVIMVPVGGGGLIGGIAAYVKAVRPNCKVIGCQPEQSKVMYESVKAGKIIFEESGETISDGTKGGIEEGAITLKVCQDFVDDWILVSEEEIQEAIFFMIDKHHKIIEGAAGLAVGALMKSAKSFQGQNVVLISCGSNISTDIIQEIINKYNTGKA